MNMSTQLENSTSTCFQLQSLLLSLIVLVHGEGSFFEKMAGSSTRESWVASEETLMSVLRVALGDPTALRLDEPTEQQIGRAHV